MLQSFKPEKQFIYLSRKASRALFIIMICMAVQEISVGLDLCYNYVYGTCFHSKFVSCVVGVLKKKSDKMRKLLLLL
jgi:hypothetical protein